MATEVNWRPHPLVSVLHAVCALCHKATLADTRLSEALQAPASQWAADIAAAHLPAERFWGHLIPLAAQIENRRQLVETALAKTIGRGPRLDAVLATLATSLAAVDAAARPLMAPWTEELALRQRPLREQWEARGPGLLTQIGYLTEESLLVANCEVLLVHPALGGGGKAHLAYNSVRIEAVLANPVSELPEVVRLAWLISQLQLDLPKYSESIHADRLPHIARFAMLPATLLAAQTVELSRYTPEAVQLAISTWRLRSPPDIDA